MSTTLMLGETRMGKSTKASLRKRKAKKRLITELQNSIGRMEIAKELAAGREGTLFVDECRRTDRTPGIIHVYESSSDDPFQKLGNDRCLREDEIAWINSLRNLDGISNPLMLERLDEALSVHQYQREFKPLYWFPWTVRPGSPSYYEILNGCWNTKARRAVDWWSTFNLVQQRTELGPVQRLVTPIFEDATIMSRCGDQSAEEIFKKYDTIVVMGSGAPSVGSFLVRKRWVYEAINFIRKYREPMEIIIDEASNEGLPGRGFFCDKIQRSILTDAKYGAHYTFCFQTPHVLDREIQAMLFDSAKEIYCFRMGNPESVALMSDRFGTPQLNPDKISHHRVKERQVHDGYDDDGKAKYGFILDHDPVYQPLSDQTRLVGRDLMNQGVGEYMYAGPGGVGSCKDPKPLEPFGWKEITEQKVDEFLERVVWERPEYQTPELIKPSGKHKPKKDNRGGKGGKKR